MGERDDLDPQLAAALTHAQAFARAQGRTQVAPEDLLRALVPQPTTPPERARITPYKDGPYLLRGPFVITDQDGTPIDTGRRTVALCRCGRSQLRPFCDGTHKSIGFEAAGGREPTERPGE